MSNSTLPWFPFGEALFDFWNGNKKAKLNIHMADGTISEMPMQVFFRTENEMPGIEITALNICEGKTLDVGAGSGSHSLILQQKGHEVHALDIAPQAVEVMNQRKVKKPTCSDFLTFNNAEKFDTLLFLMNGIGIAETIDGLEKYLTHAHQLTTDQGQIVLDSSDLSKRKDLDLEPSSKDYFGEITYYLEYKGIKGTTYQWLYVDPKTLDRIAQRTNWHIESLYGETDGSYLARLRKR